MQNSLRGCYYVYLFFVSKHIFSRVTNNFFLFVLTNTTHSNKTSTSPSVCVDKYNSLEQNVYLSFCLCWQIQLTRTKRLPLFLFVLTNTTHSNKTSTSPSVCVDKYNSLEQNVYLSFCLCWQIQLIRTKRLPLFLFVLTNTTHSNKTSTSLSVCVDKYNSLEQNVYLSFCLCWQIQLTRTKRLPLLLFVLTNTTHSNKTSTSPSVCVDKYNSVEQNVYLSFCLCWQIQLTRTKRLPLLLFVLTNTTHSNKTSTSPSVCVDKYNSFEQNVYLSFCLCWQIQLTRTKRLPLLLFVLTNTTHSNKTSTSLSVCVDKYNSLEQNVYLSFCLCWQIQLIRTKRLPLFLFVLTNTTHSNKTSTSLSVCVDKYNSLEQNVYLSFCLCWQIQLTRTKRLPLLLFVLTNTTHSNKTSTSLSVCVDKYNSLEQNVYLSFCLCWQIQLTRTKRLPLLLFVLTNTTHSNKTSTSPSVCVDKYNSVEQNVYLSFCLCWQIQLTRTKRLPLLLFVLTNTTHSNKTSTSPSVCVDKYNSLEQNVYLSFCLCWQIQLSRTKRLPLLLLATKLMQDETRAHDFLVTAILVDSNCNQRERGGGVTMITKT